MDKVVWKDGKKVAFALCFDLDSDTIWYNKIRHYDGGMQFLRGPHVGRYGPKRGADRIMRILERYSLHATFFVPGVVAESNGPLLNRMLEEGHEIAHHGLTHEASYGDTLEEQMAILDRCQEIFRRVTGRKAVGFRPTGNLLPETQRVLFRDPDTLYYAHGAMGEDPQFVSVEGEETRVVYLPCRLEMDDYIQMTYNCWPPIPSGLPRISAYEDVLSNFRDELDGAIRYGGCVTTAFHPQVSGSPGKSLILEQLIEYALNTGEIWIARCDEIAAYWRNAHTPEALHV